MDDNAFWVSATGQSMIPEGIDGGCVCLVSPNAQVRAGDRVWILDFQKRATIKRLVEKKENGSLTLRGWMPMRDGQQQSFDEERLPAGIREVYPVVAVFRGKPGTEAAEYIPDPKPPAHDAPPESPPGTLNIAPLERIPKAITDMLGLPEGASADAVLQAMQAKLADRGTAHATPVAALERKVERTLKSETRSLKDDLKDELVALLDARLPPAPEKQARIDGRVTLPFVSDLHLDPEAGSVRFEATGTTIGIPSDVLPPEMKPEHAVAIQAQGNSMEPTIRSGDFLVIDTSERTSEPGRIFVLQTRDGLAIKRLQRDGPENQQTWTMTSDNAEGFPPRPVTEEDRILGRVIWFGPEKAVVVAGG